MDLRVECTTTGQRWASASVVAIPADFVTLLRAVAVLQRLGMATKAANASFVAILADFVILQIYIINSMIFRLG